MLKKQIHCPKCNGPTGRWLRYAFSSWLLPLSCGRCGSKFFLGYSPLAFLLLWFLISPAYLAALLFLMVALLPDLAILPGFIAAGFLSMLLLVFVGKPTLKDLPAARRRPPSA